MVQEQHFHAPVGQVAGQDINNDCYTREELEAYDADQLASAYSHTTREISQAERRKHLSRPALLTLVGGVCFLLAFPFIHQQLQSLDTPLLIMIGLLLCWLGGFVARKVQDIGKREDQRIKHLHDLRGVIVQEMVRREVSRSG